MYTPKPSSGRTLKTFEIKFVSVEAPLEGKMIHWGNVVKLLGEGYYALKYLIYLGVTNEGEGHNHPPLQRESPF